jgi:protein-S-isoprenylcysteine O-methyltransferase Ste14
MKSYLFVFILLFLFIGFFWPSWMLYRKTGINPYAIPTDDSVHGFAGIIFKAAILLVLFVVGAYVFFPEVYIYMIPINYIESYPAFFSGFLLMHAGLVIMLIAQHQMRLSWRIGIDEKSDTEFVSHGLFRFSRNPIFLGLLIMLAGLFFALPNAILLLVFGVSWAMIQVQVRLEEEFLMKKHGSKYEKYKSEVRRWF